MRRYLLMVPAVVLLVIGGLIVASAGQQPDFRSQSMPGNYQFLTITNPSGFGQDGFPVFAGSGPQQVFFQRLTKRRLF